MKRVAVQFVRIVVLTMVLFVSFSLGAAWSGVAGSNPSVPGADATGTALTLFFVCFLVTAVLTWMVSRSRFWGWRLVATVFLAVFGLGTALPQVESAVFLSDHLPPGFVVRLFVMGAITGVLFAPATAWILGKIRRPEGATSRLPPGMTALQWTSRVAVLAGVYVPLYFLAGYFVAFRNPELIAYYKDADPGSFLAQMEKVWATTPWLFGFQLLRGALWIAVVAPVVVSFVGRRLELAFLIGCLFSVWCLMLLLPNPYMPPSVRLSHLLETLPSQFLFGWLAGVLLGRGP
jgi:hypothetical protein